MGSDPAARTAGNAAAPNVDGFYNPVWGGLANTVSNGVCVNTSGSGGLGIDIWYDAS